MLRRISSFVPKYTLPKVSYVRPNYFCTSPKPSEQDTQKEKEAKIVITPKKLLIGLVSISWVGLLYLWYSVQERTRERAAEYYEQGNSMDMQPPEEYRKEYVKEFIISS